MNVADQFMMQQMQQMSSGMASPPKTPSSVKQEANETFQDLIQKKRQEIVKDEKDVIPNKKPAQNPGQEGSEPVQEDTSAVQKPSQEGAVQEEEPTLAETGYIPAELLLAGQLVQVEPEVQPESVETAVPVVEMEGENGLSVQPELAQGPQVQEQEVQPQLQQEQTAGSFGQELKQAAEPQQEQTVEVQPQQTAQEQTQVRPEGVEQKTENVQAEGQEDGTEVLEAQEAPEAPLFRDVERAPVKVGEPEKLDTQQPDMEAQLAQKIQQAVQQGAQRVEIRLTPENLGELTIQMTRNTDGSLQVVLHTATEKALSLLSQHAEQMTVLLQGGGQQVQLEVRQNDESQQAQQQNQQNQQQADADGHNQNQQRQPKHQEQHRNSQDFMQQMRLGLIQEGV